MTDTSTPMLEALASVQYKDRFEKAQRFERIRGGGIVKQLERLFVSPEIYIPYLCYTRLGFSHWRRTPIKLFWGRVIQMPLSDYDALTLYMYGALHVSERKLIKFFLKNLKPDDVFYDIGANRGFYTFLASELCEETHAFEPMSKLASVIKQNVRKNEKIVINTVALSNMNGPIDFYLMDSTMTNTISAAVAEHSVSKKVRVPSITLDTYLTTHTKPTVLKIDAEGAEERVIEGGTNFFSSYEPVIAMEIWGKENEWELSMRAAQRLRGMGYRSWRLDEEGNAQEVTSDLSALVSSHGGENFVFKK